MGVDWTTDQQHAIECCKGSVLVSAAAGSGKTTVLVERVIRRLTDEAAKKIDKKISDDASKIIREFPGTDPAVSILNGRFGPYIKVGRENVKIPKDTDPASLSLEDCLALQKKQAEAPKKSSARRFVRKKS